MKDKVLRTAVTSAAESIAQALHSYSNREIYCQILIDTRNKRLNENTDVYRIDIVYGHNDDRGEESILKVDAKVTYLINHGNELIRKVDFIKEKGGEKDGP